MKEEAAEPTDAETLNPKRYFTWGGDKLKQQPFSIVAHVSLLPPHGHFAMKPFNDLSVASKKFAARPVHDYGAKNRHGDINNHIWHS